MKQNNLLLLTFTIGICLPLQQAVLHETSELFGWSDVDLHSFQYFKNLQSQDPKNAAHANLFLEHFQKKKAVLDYFENLFFGNSPFTQESEISFDPNFGKAWRPFYVQKYGWRGERLIAALGKGYSTKQLGQYGTKPNNFRIIYRPS